MSQASNPQTHDEKIAALQARVAELERELSAHRDAQKTHRDADSRLRHHLNNTPVGVIEWGGDFRLLRWSPGAEQLFGWSAKELEGKHLGDWPFVYEDDVQRVDETARRLMSGQDKNNICVNRNYRRDGSVQYFQWSNFAMHDEQGQLVSVFSQVQEVDPIRNVPSSPPDDLKASLNREITQRSHAEADAATANSRMEFMLSATPVVIYSCLVGHPHEPIFISENVAQVFGYSMERFLDSPSFWLDQVHPEDRPALEQSNTCISSKAQQVREYRFRCGDGQYRWMRDAIRQTPICVAMPIEGHTEKLVGYCLDIHEQKQAQQQLVLVQSAIDQVVESVVITDNLIDLPGPRIIYANPAFYHITGYTPEEVIGRSPRILQGPDSNRSVLDEVRRHLEEGRPFQGGTVNYRKDASPIHVEWQIAPIHNASGRVINWVSIQRDITDQKKQAEEASRRDAEMVHVARLSTLGEMASGLAHELNQPLAAITNYAQGCKRRLSQQELSADELSAVLDRVIEQAQRSGAIIRRMRHFARKREAQREAASINDLIRNVVALLEPQARRQQVTVHLDLADGLPALELDTIQIEQVLVNLIHNSFDAMSDTPVADRQVTIQTVMDAQTVRLAVRDAGVGLPTQKPDRMFDPFFTTKPQGMGMGLNISESIVHAHQGKIAGQNNADRGATFTLTLPCHA